ncbi:LysE family translocator [Antarctobacter heliothermus]|uniref:Threonine/homoserine/homoserine lactone efflux protein n=1 Tax=Antarctobacter heliothermus TaxID=74033 RepID=A0A239C111_9RHOB|nr:LysE family transporter [Antarctobacter heliothermus]SNS13927.1 Threonine/homoserine/homoserine lactone efflux protein [Antarctobacter heliothermus]
MSDVPQFLAVAFALTGSPGPNTLSVAAVGAAFGRRRGLGYMAGLTLGMLGVIAIVGSGLSALLLALPGVAPAVTVVAAAYFLWLAWRIATAPPIGLAKAQGQPPRWTEGALLSLVNPKAYAAMAAAFSGFTLVTGAPVGDALVKTALLMLTILAVNLAWLLAGSLLTRIVRNPRAGRIINLTFAGALLVAVAATALL